MNTVDSASPANRSFWQSLFAANSIAVIGANNEVASWGFEALRVSLASIKTDPKRQVYAVNPNVRQIQGLSSYSSILEIPGPVELAIIVVRATIVPSVLRECVRKNVKAAVIISAGFAETDEAGIKLEAELVKIATEGGLRFVGPNCLGHADAHTQVASAGVIGRIGPGNMALISQSGTVGASIIQAIATSGLGLSKFVGTGNEANVHFEDYLEYLAQDKDTHIIGAYIEGLREGRRFFNLAKQITTHKPVVAMKVGSTSGSSKAAKSHTGALAGSDAIYSAAFKQAGVIRVEDEEELADVAVALLSQPLPRGKGVGILTMGGGFGVVTAEVCEKEGLVIASLEPQTIEKLNAVLPPRWSHGNPVDLVGIRPTIGDPTTFSCLRSLMEDTNVDTVLSLIPLVFAPPPGMAGNFTAEQIQNMSEQSQKHIELINQQVRQYRKPLFMVGRFIPQPALDHYNASRGVKDRIPEYANARRVAKVLKQLTWYRQYLSKGGAE